VGALLDDLRYTAGRLARTPFFTLGALAIVAIAIGANTAAFSVVNKLLLTPPPFESPEEVVNVYQDSDDGEPSSNSYPAYRDMAALGGVFRSVAATSPDRATLEVEGAKQQVALEYTTSTFLETLGRSPVRGRWFDRSMDQVGTGNYAVVSEHSWRNRFGSDPGIVGRTLRFNGQPVEVIGVGPTGFNGVGGFVVTDFWLSISSVGVSGDFRVSNLDRREDHWYDVKARLAPGVTVTRAQEAMNALAQRLAEDFPDMNRGRGITVFPASEIRLHPGMDRSLYSVAGALMTIVVLVLILASSNLGSLLLVRGVARSPEMAVRRAMGAGPWRVARLFLSEALVLSLVGGVLGLLLAHWLLGALVTLPLPGVAGQTVDLAMDPRVLLFSLGLMVATGLFFGWAPAMQSLSLNFSQVLREDRRSAGRSRRLSLFRNLMVAVQVAVSLILAVGTGAMVRSLASYYRVDPGVDEGRLAYLQTDFTQAGIQPEERGSLLRQLVERVEALPTVDRVGMTSRIPVQGGGTTTTVIEGYEPEAGTGSVELNWALVSPGYFQTMGIQVLEGRGYLPEDQAGDERQVIVNEAAGRFWRGETPVGKRIRPQSVPDGWVQVVGMVSDTKVRSLSEPATPILYYLMGENGINVPYIVARTSADPAALLQGLRRELAAVDPALPVAGLSTMTDHIGESLTAPRLSARLLGLFSLLALLLASVGIYTIVSFSVAGRMSEIGIRIALGAEGSRVVGMVVREMASTVGVGVLVGAVVVALATPRFQGVVFGVDILSPGTLLPALLVLGLSVAIASVLPALRAASVDPVEALRVE
jgi:predicted permease